MMMISVCFPTIFLFIFLVFNVHFHPTTTPQLPHNHPTTTPQYTTTMQHNAPQYVDSKIKNVVSSAILQATLNLFSNSVSCTKQLRIVHIYVIYTYVCVSVCAETITFSEVSYTIKRAVCLLVEVLTFTL